MIWSLSEQLLKNGGGKTIEFLRSNGHVCEEVPMGSERFIKVDNKYYRIFPSTRSCKVPIQGIELLPVYR